MGPELEATKYGAAEEPDVSCSEGKHAEQVPDVWHSSRKTPKPRASTKYAQLLLCAVCFIDGADIQLLPASFRALEVDLGLSPAGLGKMSFAQSLFTSVAAPLWGVLADRYSRKSLLVFSCTLWGILTASLACASSISTVFALRCAHGITLASLNPISQSVVADLVEQERRGTVFGRLDFARGLGQTLSSLFGTWIASETLASGVRGWRATFMVVAGLSILTGIFFYKFFVDPVREQSADTSTCAGQSGRGLYACCTEIKKAARLLRLPTFVVIVLQGMFGSVPWNALGFMPMFMQYSGHNAGSAALVTSTMLVGVCFGSIIGGWLGDALSRRCPAHGRPFTAQLSVASGIPLIGGLIWSAPRADVSVLMTIGFVFGLTATWCSAGVNRPIMTEIVDPAYRATVIAWLTAIDGSCAALFGAPVVGFLAEGVFGYKEVRDVKLVDGELRQSNAEALGSALLWGAIPPWALCFAFYSLLHCTYARDAALATTYAEFADEGLDALEFPEVVQSEDTQEAEANGQRVGHRTDKKPGHKATRGYGALGKGRAMDTQDTDDVTGDAI